MLEELHHVKGKRVSLTKEIHQSLAYFCWLVQELERLPNCLYKLVPLQPTLDGYHDTYGYMCQGVVNPGPTAVPRTLQPQPRAVKPTPDTTGAHPIVWRATLPKDVSTSLVSWKNPDSQVTNSDLELDDIVIHHVCMTDCYDVWEGITPDRTDTTDGLWWKRKGSTTFTHPPPPPRTT